MVKRYLQNIDIECWVYRGALGSSRPTLCVFHKNAEPCTPILLALNELESEGAPAKRTLTFQPSQRKQSIATLRLELLAESDQLRVMSIACREGVATIAMTPAGLRAVREAMNAWGNGAEDFGLSSESSGFTKKQLGPLDLASLELWFWGPDFVP